jgi:hypothetical protein
VTMFTSVRQNGARGPGRGHRAIGTAPKPPLQLLAFEDDAVPFLEDAWLVEDVLPEEGLGVIFGAPGSRKTFTSIDMALHIAGGYEHWRGKRVERRLCMYLSLEGGRRFSNRLAAWRQYHGRDAPLFYRCAEKLDLRSHEDDAERVISAGKALVEQTSERMGLIVVDTLNRAMPGGNENAAEDMGAFVALCDAIAREQQCFVLIVHHSGKDMAKGSRGHSCLLGAIDTEICVADGMMTVTKQRDGDTDKLQFAVGLEKVELGTTPTGKAVTSCVVVEEHEGAPRSARRLTPSQQATVEALREYIDVHGKPNPYGIGWPAPGTQKIVELDGLLTFLAGKQTSPTDSERRKQAGRKLERLCHLGVVEVNQGFTWLVR